MKRLQDTQEANDSKKPRLNQYSYNELYSQYGLLSQYGGANPFGQNGASFTANYGQPAASLYGLNYGNANMMGASQYGYPQAFFNPAAAAAAAGYNTAEGNRTIYLGGIPPGTTPSEILKQVKTGAIESYRALAEKACVFLSFVDPSSAQLLYQELSFKKMIINGQEIKHGWGNSSSIPLSLKVKIQAGATRAVYIGKIDSSLTKEKLTAEAIKYGPIEEVKVVVEKSCAFVHFLNIASAVKCVTELPTIPEWQSKRVNYAKDHCAGNLTNESFTSPASFGFDAYGNPMMPTLGLQTSPNAGNILRTIYIGSLQPDVKYEDICNAIRGGNVLQVRYFPDKHIAFVSFMDAGTAISVFNYANSQGLVIKGKRVRVGWGKPSTIPSQVAQAIQQGATRNVYIGGIDETVNEDKLRQDFEQFGEIELVNTHKEKSCAFVNFTSVNSAVAAVAGIKLKNSEYQAFKINYGKDRCGNPPRIKNQDINGKKVEVKTEEQ
ncbi:hypothetical protein G6F46_009027 [Rhizopus delemar]|uniref:RRM domain-containing protein n=2 Tax=Rhizopus TaxID=4842 RepID=A0A9P7CKZ2_9FUNG|nr:hypothetical protein G6F55_006662 [Rhizopus delemar]KAG1552375.1 hypothetical protein G6F51_001256 [Rhizopus arrhizus]KAG1493662.1 hypothetical protein G6F54_008420 [Rhizopus delemar]KAG1509598.1 hypothetical protein G6F53_007322 [Rhizopus delemar]KAG1525033.1 hypothetical protein G6F52_003683 [Rhizopus delemar]